MSFPTVEGYVICQILGSGSYSTVYKAFKKVGARSILAIKCVEKSKIKNSESIDNVITEIRLLKTLKHPHIVQMKEFKWDDRNIYIIMEHCSGGDLSKYIKKYGTIPENKVLLFFQQLGAALKYLYDKGVAHMDLKPHNLLLHRDYEGQYIIKVADFGFAQYLSEETMRTIRGSPLYMAPEMLSGEYDARVDLWSVGAIFYECLFGKTPYSSATLEELLDKMQRQVPIEIPRHPRTSRGCQEMLIRLLQPNPEFRISHEEFFGHLYLDLKYMPSREHYDTAVNLVEHAIEMDVKGQWEEALESYTEGLRFLARTVYLENDKMKRKALTTKLNSYVARVEHIKKLMKKKQKMTSVTPGPSRSPHTQTNCTPDSTHSPRTQTNLTPDPTHSPRTQTHFTPDPSRSPRTQTNFTPDPSRSPRTQTNFTPDPSRSPRTQTNFTPNPSRSPRTQTNFTPNPSRSPRTQTNFTPNPSRSPRTQTNFTPDPTHSPRIETDFTPDPTHSPRKQTDFTPDPTHSPGTETDFTPDPTHSPRTETDFTPDPTHSPRTETDFTPDPTHSPRTQADFTPDPTHSPRSQTGETNILCCTGEASGNTYEFIELTKDETNENIKEPVEDESSNDYVIVQEENEGECWDEMTTMTLRRRQVPSLNNEEVIEEIPEKTKSDNADSTCRIT